MKQTFPLLLCAALLLPACVAEPVPPLADGSLASCGADELKYLVGQPGAVLDGMRFGQDVRVITPGMAVTEDYSPSRLNIDLDAGGRISRLWCG